MSNDEFERKMRELDGEVVLDEDFIREVLKEEKDESQEQPQNKRTVKYDNEASVDEDLKTMLTAMATMNNTLSRNTDILQANTKEIRELKHTIQNFARSFLSQWLNEIKLNIEELSEAEDPKEVEIVVKALKELTTINMDKEISDAYSNNEELEDRVRDMIDGIHEDIDARLTSIYTATTNNLKTLGQSMSMRFNVLENILSDIKSVSANTSDMVGAMPRSYQ